VEQKVFEKWSKKFLKSGAKSREKWSKKFLKKLIEGFAPLSTSLRITS